MKGTRGTAQAKSGEIDERSAIHPSMRIWRQALREEEENVATQSAQEQVWASSSRTCSGSRRYTILTQLMPQVIAKRQTTLPIDQWREVGIGPGDECRGFVADGRITIVRKTASAAKGFLRHVAGDADGSDEMSRCMAISPIFTGSGRRHPAG